jgi:valyl-tRNA synthetase
LYYICLEDIWKQESFFDDVLGSSAYFGWAGKKMSKSVGNVIDPHELLVKLRG